MSAVNAGPRLDRLPVSAFHRRVFVLVAIGMFFDGFDIYIAGTVLGTTLHTGFSTMGQNASFVSMTFVGMMLGSFFTGFLGDRFGRRFTYQANLALFGLASLAAAFAPNMTVLIGLRFLMGIGLGAENVVGYATLTEFAPARDRGRWLGFLAVVVVTGLPIAVLISTVMIPAFGWRSMFVLGGIGALVVWYIRKSLPESPRWLESVGRFAEAETLLRRIEAEAAPGLNPPLPKPPMPESPVLASAAAPPSRALSTLFAPPLLARMVLGCIALIVINTLIYGFITWLPAFFVKQGLSIATSFNFTLIMSLGAPVGATIGALTADRWGRKPTLVGAAALAIIFGAIYPFIHDPALLPIVGLALTIPIYVLVALLFGIYIPELFPTEVRLRAAGICNTFGRGATILTPFIVVSLFTNYGIVGVLAMMIGLLAVLIVTVLGLGIEPRQRSLEELASQPDELPDPASAAAR
ncbi:MFS transporter [Rhodopila sp.]|uniref:MFS transporter n=1 Tax=Rhodopila sp. TaxID=2480087 RepID=UPI003D0EB0B7